MSPAASSPRETLALERAFHHAADHLAGLDARPVGATLSPEALRANLDVGLHDHGVAPAQVVDELVEAVRGGLHGMAGARFFAWVIGGALPAALATDWLVSAWDQNAALHACSPASGVVEEVAGKWLLEILDLPRDASFAFTTGCQMAHLTCLAAARNAVLAAAGWEVETQGLFGAPPIRILANDQRHGTIGRAVRMLGLGTNAVRALPTGEDGRLPPGTLRAALAEGGGPTILLLDAGDLNVGGCDPFAELVPLAKAAGAWVHVDGAFGLWARASRAHRHLVEGVELADSWASDAHKWLNTPNDCGLAFVRDTVAHRAAMTLTADYLVAGGGVRDQIDWTPEWTRRARGFPVYAALRELGRNGVADLIDRCCGHALALTEGIGALDGAELVARPTLNQGLVRFPSLRPGATDAEHDRRNDELIAAINATGEAFFSGTVWRGRRAMRISVCNWRTGEADVRRTVAAVAKVLAA